MDDEYPTGNRYGERCYCEHCRTEGEVEQGRDCLWWGGRVASMPDWI